MRKKQRRQRQIFGILAIVVTLISQLNILSVFAEGDKVPEKTNEISVQRKLDDGTTTQGDGSVAIDEDVILEISNTNEADTSVTVPLGDNFVYNEELTAELNKEHEDIKITYENSTNSVDISWSEEEAGHHASLAITATKVSDNAIYAKTVRDDQEYRSDSINIMVQEQDIAELTNDEEIDSVMSEEDENQEEHQEDVENNENTDKEEHVEADEADAEVEVAEEETTDENTEEATRALVAEPSALSVEESDFNVGDIFEADGRNWIVIKNDGTHVLVLSERTVGTSRFRTINGAGAGIALQEAMDDFYNLEIEELEAYAVGVSNTTTSTNISGSTATNPGELTTVNRNNQPTAFALSIGDVVISEALDTLNKRIAYNESGTVAGWWLRSPFGELPSTLGTFRAWNVGSNGSTTLDATGRSVVSNANGVRPALMLDLES